jgi:hypothetical protein
VSLAATSQKHLISRFMGVVTKINHWGNLLLDVPIHTGILMLEITYINHDVSSRRQGLDLD